MSLSDRRGPFERALTQAWYQRGVSWVWLLLPLSLLFGLVASFRKLLQSHEANADSVPVVVIGGITVGGTGKTPVIIALGKQLSERGYRVAVVSRGYGGSFEGAMHRVDQNDPANLVGDEPALIARSGVATVFVGKDRAALTEQVAKTCEFDVILADDGLQHYRMARHLEIAVLDAERGTGNGLLLPAGPLRECPSRLASVDYVLWRNGTDEETAFRYAMTGIRNYASGELLQADLFRQQCTQQKVVAMTGLGQPQQFSKTLTSIDIDHELIVFPDHHPFSSSDIAAVDADIILMTAKDAVKLDPSIDRRIWVAEISTVLPLALIERVCHSINLYQSKHQHAQPQK